LADLARRKGNEVAQPRLRCRPSLSNNLGLEAYAPSSGKRSLLSAFVTLRAEAHDRAEARRILYVAATRARERLVFVSSGNPEKPEGAWLERLQSCFGDSARADVALRSVAPPARVSPPAARNEVDVVPAARRFLEIQEIIRAAPRPRVVSASRLAELDAAPGANATIPTSSSSAARSAPLARALGAAPGSPLARALGAAPASPLARALGAALHVLLERAEFARGGPLATTAQIELQAKKLCVSTGVDPQRLIDETTRLWRAFENGEIRKRLARARIVARELPVFATLLATPPATSSSANEPMTQQFQTHNSSGDLCVGVADLLFEEGNDWIVADWKTDSVASEEEIGDAASRHRTQVSFYAQAIAQAAGRPVRGELFFIRADRSICL
jgi:ATP-dependent exoDNAse (exonuclease V) beta subunit